MPETNPAGPQPTIEGGNDTDPNDRVHHHARVHDERPNPADGAYTTLCGLKIRPRPEAARLPCCPMCALTMGAPCR